MKGLLTSILLLCIPVCLSSSAQRVVPDTSKGKPARYAGNFSAKPIPLPDRYTPRRELRGIWVATIENLDFKVSSSPAEFRQQFRKIVANLKTGNFNALFFQVRPLNDAFYPSRYNPSSRFMLGKEGGSMGGFDPLKFMVEECRKNNIEFHAWLNPYRVNAKSPLPKRQYLPTLSSKNFAWKYPETVLERKTGKVYSLFLDPGNPKVREHIFNTVRELANNYDIDGIHFDDYFYLYDDIGTIDQNSFRRHNPQRLPLAQWRRNNVDQVISGVHRDLQQISLRKGRKIQFGVSPFGIWANKKNTKYGSLTGGKESYFVQFADTRKWVRSGWVDYIAPQIYWPFSHDVAAYAALTDWWCQTVRGTKVRLYIGHAVYQLGSSRKFSENELYWQLLYNNKKPEISGSILFRYSNFFHPSNPVMVSGVKKVRKLWQKQ
ncbi:MAG: family 10 glycosylhydrolase [Lentisphaeria bacterium]|nr:family 10 glycosylhydrolase [Lentisphaeria bacterium]